jgi:hypothetical protein
MEIERIKVFEKDKNVEKIEKVVNLKVADIELVFHTAKLINLLENRGFLIAQGKFDKIKN